MIAEATIREKQKPFVIASGITTSGPVHLGTVCEFLYPSAINDYLRDQGYATRFVFVADLMDAFDSIPALLRELRSRLQDELGKPLHEVEDPFGCCPSYGEHYLQQVIEVMERFQVKPGIVRANELYRQGSYDRYARLFIQRLEEVKRLLEEVSMRTLPPGWQDIVLPVCENCGKIGTTSVEQFDGDTIAYSCSKDAGYAEGCGYEGETTIADHRYKLLWRLDWPSRQDFLRVAIEGAGVDHHTRGGSWDTAVAVHRRIFRREPPIGFKYGFLLFRGKKYSKSTGLGADVQQLLDLVPPEVLKFFLFKPDVSDNKEFDPTGYRLAKLYEDYMDASELVGREELTRAEHKTLLAYKLAGGIKWKVSFVDILANYQILHSWKAVAKRLGDPSGIYYLRPYIENWIEYGYVPPELKFEYSPTRIGEYAREIAMFARKLKKSMRDIDVHNLVYEVAQETGIRPPRLFKALYKALIKKGRGPRFGKLVAAIGVAKVKRDLLRLYASE